MSSSLDAPEQKSDAAARAPVPEWLYRIERDETRALLRASSEFARVGYAPFLEKAKDAMGNIIKDASGQAKKVNGDPSGFKNHFLGCVTGVAFFLLKTWRESLQKP